MTTIYTLDGVYTQVILPSQFKIKAVDAKKNSIKETNFATGGFWAHIDDGSTFPVGNLVIDGQVVSNAATNPNWINVAGKDLTTLIVYGDNRITMKRIGDISTEPNIKYAISGIPILRDGYSVDTAVQIAEGYFGSEMYDTWHTFLGIRDRKIVLVGAKCGSAQMPYLMEVLGLNDSIKLDGGGSFIMHSMDLTKKTFENRRIFDIITW